MTDDAGLQAHHPRAVRDALDVLRQHGWEVQEQTGFGHVHGGFLVGASWQGEQGAAMHRATVVREPWRQDPAPDLDVQGRVAHNWRAFLSRLGMPRRFEMNLPDPDADVCGALPAAADLAKHPVSTCSPCLLPPHPATGAKVVHTGLLFEARFGPGTEPYATRWSWTAYRKPGQVVAR